jgi:hypothetical protein
MRLTGETEACEGPAKDGWVRSIGVRCKGFVVLGLFKEKHMSKNEDMAKQVEAQAGAAAKAITGMVGQMIDDGVASAALVEALAGVLGAVMADAPRHMAERLDVSVMAKVRQSRAATWAALDAAAVH